jgi:hypothetical protein
MFSSMFAMMFEIGVLISNNGKIVHKRYQLVPRPGALMQRDTEPQDSASGCEKWTKWAHGGVLC